MTIFFSPDVGVICADGFSAIGTLLGNAILFCPVARLYVMTIVLSIISMSWTFSGKYVEIVDFEGSPA